MSDKLNPEQREEVVSLVVDIAKAAAPVFRDYAKELWIATFLAYRARDPSADHQAAKEDADTAVKIFNRSFPA